MYTTHEHIDTSVYTSHSKIADVTVECKASRQVACWSLHLLSTITAVVNKTLEGITTLVNLLSTCITMYGSSLTYQGVIFTGCAL